MQATMKNGFLEPLDWMATSDVSDVDDSCCVTKPVEDEKSVDGGFSN